MCFPLVRDINLMLLLRSSVIGELSGAVVSRLDKTTVRAIRDHSRLGLSF